MTVVYIVHTPYHILLSMLMAQAAPLQRSALMVMPSTTGAAAVANAISESLDHPFERVYIGHGKPSGQRTRSSLFRFRKKLSENITALRAMGPRKLVVFNDGSVAMQGLIAAMQKGDPGLLVSIVEDGLGAYALSVRPSFGFFGLTTSSLIAGCKIEDVRVLGTGSKVSEFHALRPEMLRNELRGKLRVAIPLDGFRTWGGADWVRRIFDDVNLEPGILRSATTIFAPCDSMGSRSAAQYHARIPRLLRDLRDQGEEVIVKLHPADEGRIHHPLNISTTVRRVPASIPLELLLPFGTAPCLRGLWTDISTSMLSTRVLRPDLSVVSLARAVGMVPPFPEEFFPALGVIELGSLGESKNAT